MYAYTQVINTKQHIFFQIGEGYDWWEKQAGCALNF